MKHPAWIPISLSVLPLLATLGFLIMQQRDSLPLAFFEADNTAIQYLGRIDFSQPKRPRFWSSAVTIRARFTGGSCEVLLNDENLYGKQSNYISYTIDALPPVRLRLAGGPNVITVAKGLSEDAHTLTLYKDTEAAMGYLDFAGLRCKGLLPLDPLPERKIECIGDSITAGGGMDASQIPCDSGDWYDQHNASRSYGVLTARQLSARYHLTAVAGIGLIHSYNMEITMPQVFDKLNQREDLYPWDFARYQPDVVTICLGQNDGQQDRTAFENAYVRFLERIRQHCPTAQIVCLTSPMADADLIRYLKERLTAIVDRRRRSGDERVHSFFFARRYHRGCGDHPNVEDHQRIADELTAYLKTLMRW